MRDNVAFDNSFDGPLVVYNSILTKDNSENCLLHVETFERY